MTVGCSVSYARAATPEACPQPAIGSAVTQPAEIESAGGVLRVELRMRSEVDARGRVRYCYVSADGKIAPTLRLNPGDWLVVELKNEVAPPAARHDQRMPMVMGNVAAKTDPCAGGIMIDGATNLHFHGLAVPRKSVDGRLAGSSTGDSRPGADESRCGSCCDGIDAAADRVARRRGRNFE